MGNIDKPLTIIIFSKDRAAQLDLCLKSIYKNLDSLSQKWTINVIYTASSEEFHKGYDELQYYWNYSGLHFTNESLKGGFKETLELSMEEYGKYVLFFTDDDILYRYFEHDFDLIDNALVNNKELFSISLRLGTNTFIQDQYKNTKCIMPDEIIEGDEILRRWEWKKQSCQSNFAYPFSLDGHIFRSEDVQWLIKNTPGYYNPNSFEGKINRFHILDTLGENIGNKMSCFEYSYVINTPLNRVQKTCVNESGIFFNAPTISLNERFLRGESIDLESLDFSTIIGVHQEIQLKWKKTNESKI